MHYQNTTKIHNKTCRISLLYMRQMHIQNPFKRLSNEVTSLKVTIFPKSSILDVLQGCECAIEQ